MDAENTTQSQDNYLELADGGGRLLRNPAEPFHPRPRTVWPRRVNLLPSEVPESRV